MSSDIHPLNRHKTPTSPHLKWDYFSLTIFALITTFVTRRQYLLKGYYKDDFFYLHSGVLKIEDIPTIFSPTGIEWFYRPFTILYFRAFNLIGFGAEARHAISIGLCALCFALQSILATRISQSRL